MSDFFETKETAEETPKRERKSKERSTKKLEQIMNMLKKGNLDKAVKSLSNLEDRFDEEIKKQKKKSTRNTVIGTLSGMTAGIGGTVLVNHMMKSVKKKSGEGVSEAGWSGSIDIEL